MIRVLLCTERRDDWLLASAFLSRDSADAYHLDWVSSHQQTEHALEREEHDVYLIDAQIGGGRGLTLAQGAARRTRRPILVLTRKADAAIEKRAMANGVAEILVRPEITPHWLDQSIRHALTRSEQRGESLVTVAVPLTVLRARLHQAVERARKRLGGVALLAVGIDWKSVTEASPAFNDAALRAAALERIQMCLRDIDTVCQTGEGVLIVIEDPDPKLVAARLGDRILSELSSSFAVRGAVYQAATSIGVGLFPDDGQSADDLFSHANTSLETARSSGGEKMRFPSRQTDVRLARRIFLEKAIGGALEREDFHLVYQPQIDILTEDTVGAEALLRWRHPELGDVGPDEFIPILEASDLIATVGNWVLLSACKQAATWMSQGIETRVSVNVSAKQFELGTISEGIASALAHSGLPARLLGIELTESIMLAATSGVRETLNALRDLGVYVAVDDFGTGYASLRYVKDFPMDAIKIDREFVRGLPLDEHNAAITNAIVALARSLNLNVIAEGVETDAEQEFLKSLTCNVIQGYLHARPLATEQFESWYIERAIRKPQSHPSLALKAD